MRILVSSSPGVGHLLPLLPLARAARARGHEVRIVGGASLAAIATAAGFPFDAVGPATIGAAGAAVPEIAALTGRRRAVATFRDVFCGSIATGVADDLEPVIADWRPDLVVREDMDFGASIAAEARGILVATVQATAWRPEMRRLAVEPLNAIRVRNGLPDDPELRQLHGAIFFTTRPPSLRDPAAPMPASTAELRPVADDRRPDDPDDDPFPPRDGRPRVAVTLGTVNASQADVLRHIVDGAVAAGADVVVALGADPATFGPAPPQVTLRAYVPMSRLLPASDVVAFHGGSGTMLAAAAVGVPMVIVPLGADQPDNADRTEAAGIARAVQLEGLSADAVRTALEAVLGDPRYRSRAAAVAAEVAAMPGPEAAVDQLESLAG